MEKIKSVMQETHMWIDLAAATHVRKFKRKLKRVSSYKNGLLRAPLTFLMLFQIQRVQALEEMSKKASCLEIMAMFSDQNDPLHSQLECLCIRRTIICNNHFLLRLQI